MNLKIVGLQTHEDERPLAFTVMFDDLDRGRRMVATVSEAALRDSAAHPVKQLMSSLSSAGRFTMRNTRLRP
jgi:hypothetical protein